METEPILGRRSLAIGARRTPFFLFALTVVFFIPALWLAATQSLWQFGVSNLIWAMSILAFAAVGSVVASRRPDNRIGWLLSTGALLVSAGLLSVEYATRAVVAGEWPGQETAAWLGMVLFALGVTLLLPATALHFPDGRLPSSGWRRIRTLLATLVTLCLAIPVLAPGSLSLGQWKLAGETQNPVGLPLPVLSGLQPIVVPLFFAIIVVAFTAPYWRMRRARGEERQQLKWFVYATALMAAGLVVSATATALRPGEQAGEVAVNALSALGFLAFPVAIGIAVLKYRLFEIDLVINRTLVYLALSFLLGTVYTAGVVVLPLVAPFGGGNDLVVAASTLLAAALFMPFRSRVQALVDRVFYRARYNATETIADFAARLRQGAEVEELVDDLLTVVQRTLQPATIALSLQKPT